ncbi:hypothetical protein BH09PSE1_BH09PSE1_28780 [soil metagenome]
MMRSLILSSLAVVGLAACASTGQPQETYGAATDRLAADCQARGGILTPTGGVTGRPETDNVCRISGGGSRIPGNH